MGIIWRILKNDNLRTLGAEKFEKNLVCIGVFFFLNLPLSLKFICF